MEDRELECIIAAILAVGVGTNQANVTRYRAMLTELRRTGGLVLDAPQTATKQAVHVSPVAAHEAARDR